MTARTRTILALAVATGLAGCSLWEKEPPPKEVEIKPPPPNTQIDLLIQASPLMNPDPSGVPAPIVVRVYQLAAPEAFAGATFFQLWEKDEATLGATMLGKYETAMQPGGVLRVTAPLDPKTLMLGVVAGYRDFAAVKWRSLAAFAGQEKPRWKVELQSTAVVIGKQE